MKLTLDHQVAAAVGAMLVGRLAITLDDVRAGLPPHLRAANPSLKSMTRALVSAGWASGRQEGGAIVYAPHRAEAAIGDNGPPDMDDAGAEVLAMIERVERLKAEQKVIGDDIKDVFAEAKGRGHDTAAIREIIRIRAKPPEQRHDDQARLEVYMRALGMMA